MDLWVAVVDEASGQTYYFNEATQETSWDMPAPTLPAGWEALTDEASGATYYFNSSTEETTWTLPAERQREPQAASNSVVQVPLAGVPEDEEEDDARSPLEGAFPPSGEKAKDLDKERKSLSRSRSSARRNSRDAQKLARQISSKGKQGGGGKSGVKFAGGGGGGGGGGRQLSNTAALAEALLAGGGKEGEGGGLANTLLANAPDEDDTSFEAKVARFRLFETVVLDLKGQAEFNHAQLIAALDGDAAFVKEVVRLVGVTEEGSRTATVGSWAVSAHVILVLSHRAQLQLF